MWVVALIWLKYCWKRRKTPFNPRVLGSRRTKSSGFVGGSVLGQETSEPSLLLVKPRKAWIMWAVAVIWLKYCWKRCKTPFNQSIKHHSINQSYPMKLNSHHYFYKCFPSHWIYGQSVPVEWFRPSRTSSFSIPYLSCLSKVVGHVCY